MSVQVFSLKRSIVQHKGMLGGGMITAWCGLTRPAYQVDISESGRVSPTCVRCVKIDEAQQKRTAERAAVVDDTITVADPVAANGAGGDAALTLMTQARVIGYTADGAASLGDRAYYVGAEVYGRVTCREHVGIVLAPDDSCEACDVVAKYRAHEVEMGVHDCVAPEAAVTAPVTEPVMMERPKIDSRVYALFRGLDARYRADYAEYLAACESDRRDGYRPRECEHGTDQWTDYDKICGGCEEGITMRDGLQRRTRALAEAKRRVAEVDEVFAWVLRGHVLRLNDPAVTTRAAARMARLLDADKSDW